MRFSVGILFATSLVSAFTIHRRQNDPQAPACAVTCAQQNDPSPCKPDDTACICVNPTYGQAVAQCAQSTCSTEDLQTATAVGQTLCKNAGVDVNNPVPSCALTCDQNTPKGNCSETDGACLCNNQDYIKSLAQCTSSSCTPEETQTAAHVGAALCRAYGVDISSIVGSQ